MSYEPGHENSRVVPSKVTWFAAERPTDGGTTFVRPTGDESPVERRCPDEDDR